MRGSPVRCIRNARRRYCTVAQNMCIVRLCGSLSRCVEMYTPYRYVFVSLYCCEQNRRVCLDVVFSPDGHTMGAAPTDHTQTQEDHRLITGIDGMIKDTASLAVFIQSISRRSQNPTGQQVIADLCLRGHSPRWRRQRGVATDAQNCSLFWHKQRVSWGNTSYLQHRMFSRRSPRFASVCFSVVGRTTVLYHSCVRFWVF